MNMHLLRATLIASLSFGAASVLVGCDRSDAKKAGDAVENAADKAGDAVNRGLDKAGDAVNRGINSANDAARKGADQAEDATSTARDAVGRAAQKSGESVEQAGQKVKDWASPTTAPAARPQPPPRPTSKLTSAYDGPTAQPRLPSGATEAATKNLFTRSTAAACREYRERWLADVDDFSRPRARSCP